MIPLLVNNLENPWKKFWNCSEIRHNKNSQNISLNCTILKEKVVARKSLQLIDYFESKIGNWNREIDRLVIWLWIFVSFIFLQRKQPSKRLEIKPKSKFDCLKLHIFDQICRLIYISRQSNFGTVFTKNEQQQKEACAQTSNFWPRSWAVLETAFFDAQVFFLSFLTNRNLKEAIVSIF